MDEADEGEQPGVRPVPSRHMRNAGIVFVLIGLLAIMVPAVATFAVAQLIAWTLVFWGIAGLGMALSLRDHGEWRGLGALFALVLLLGLVLALFPQAGVATLTMVVTGFILAESVLTVVVGLRLRARLANWGWLVFSGVSGIVLALIVIANWEAAQTWLLGLLIGLNFLSTGLSLIMVARLTR